MSLRSSLPVIIRPSLKNSKSKTTYKKKKSALPVSLPPWVWTEVFVPLTLSNWQSFSPSWFRQREGSSGPVSRGSLSPLFSLRDGASIPPAGCSPGGVGISVRTATCAPLPRDSWVRGAKAGGGEGLEEARGSVDLRFFLRRR